MNLLKVAKIETKEFAAKPPEETREVEADPDPTLGPKDIIGKCITVWWPTLKKWYPGVVVAHKKTRHLVRHDERSKNTPDGEDESYFEHLIGGSRQAKWRLLTQSKASD